MDTKQEGRPGGHCGGQEEEEKEEGREEGKGRSRERRRQLGGREDDQEEEGEESEEEEKGQSSSGEDGWRDVFGRGDPAAGASVWAEDGAVSLSGPGSALTHKTKLLVKAACGNVLN